MLLCVFSFVSLSCCDHSIEVYTSINEPLFMHSATSQDRKTLQYDLTQSTLDTSMLDRPVYTEDKGYRDLPA